MLDLPFSYRFRLQGDRLIISNFRILLAGPNPLGKLGGLVAGKNELAPLAYFQALSTALEGTYTADFSGNPERTPRYEYNQVLYKLDLSAVKSVDQP